MYTFHWSGRKGGMKLAWHKRNKEEGVSICKQFSSIKLATLTKEFGKITKKSIGFYLKCWSAFFNRCILTAKFEKRKEITEIIQKWIHKINKKLTKFSSTEISLRNDQRISNNEWLCIPKINNFFTGFMVIKSPIVLVKVIRSPINMNSVFFVWN